MCESKGTNGNSRGTAFPGPLTAGGAGYRQCKGRETAVRVVRSPCGNFPVKEDDVPVKGKAVSNQAFCGRF